MSVVWPARPDTPNTAKPVQLAEAPGEAAHMVRQRMFICNHEGGYR